MQITVYHRTNNDSFTRVAVVEAPTNNEMEALEYAYRYTNNVDGSWSMKIGADANDNVTVVAPLHVHEGRTYGLRSSMIGDRFYVKDGEAYSVAIMGFEVLPTYEDVK